MARPTIKTLCDMSQAEAKRQLVRSVATLDGWYEIDISPKRNIRSLQQLRYYFGVPVAYLSGFLKEQDYADWQPDICHEILKAKCLTVPVVDPRTGEVIGRRCRSTKELNTAEMADFIERCRAWLAHFFNIVTPDPDPAWREEPRRQRQPETASA